jgi:hypothetical protein
MKPISFIPAAIRSLDPECEFAYFDGTDEIRIDKSAQNITETGIRTEAIRLQAEYDAQEYARNRASAYDSIGNQLDMLMKDMKNNTTTHQESCEAVKAKFPKP